MADNIPRFYELTPPHGATFFACIVEQPVGMLTALTTRDGSWASDPSIHFADLMMPEQKLNDWDVKRVQLSQVPQGDWLKAQGYV